MPGQPQPSGLPHNLPKGFDVDFALQAARLGVWEYDPLTGVANWDQRCGELYGLTQQSLVSYQQAFEYIHPEDADLVREAVAKVLTPQSGGYSDVTFRIIGEEDKRLRWVRFMGKAEFTPAGEPYRLAGVAQDVTQPLLAQQEEMLRFKYMADNARDPFILMRQDGSFAYLNELALQRWGYTQEEARHIRVPDVDPIYNDEKFGAVFAQAQTAPIPPFETLHRRKDGTIYPVEVSMGGLVLDGQPHLFAIARDITERIEAQQALAQSEAILRGAVELAQLATWSLDVPSGQITYSDRYQQWSGADESTPMAIAFNPVHPRDQVRIQAAVAKALSPEGGGIYTEEFTLVNQKTGQERIVQAWGRTYFDEQGKPLTLTGIAQNVTEQRATQQALENQVKQRTQQLEAANDELAATIDELRASNKQQALIRQQVEESEARYRHLSQQLETQVQERTKDLEAVNKELAATHEELLTSYKEQVLARQQLEDSATALQNAMELAELGNWRVDIATSLTTLSPRLADWFGFESLTADAESFLACIAEGDRERVRTSLFNTLLPNSDGRYDEVHTIIHAKTGRKRILHAMGRSYVDAAGQPLKIEGTAQDITSQQELQLVLEQQVQQRTEQLAAINEELAASNEEYATINEELEVMTQDLNESNNLLMRSNENLQRFAYVASHDLQEPLRKIQQFGSLLKTSFADRLGEELVYLDRMQSAASRMSVLIRDLLNFSRISSQREADEPVSLAQVLQLVLSDLDLVIAETGAQVQVDALPTILGDASQLGQLFSNLLGNALKFRRTDEAPVIAVKARWLSAEHIPGAIRPTRQAIGYHLIEVVDNGIGFDVKYLDRMFEVFQRLHGRSAYTGTGIGLAICEKVVTNHGGAITAHSQPGQGATFQVYLPV